MIPTDPWDWVRDDIDRADDMLTQAGNQATPDPNHPYEFWAMNDMAQAIRHMYEILRPKEQVADD